MTDWAHVLAQFLDGVGIGRAHLAGLSWGGILAQELYRLDPTRVRSLVLADTYAGWKGSFSETVAAQRLERCRRESLLPATELARLWVPTEFFTAAAPDNLVDEMTAVAREFHPHGFRLMAQSTAETDTTDLLPHIDVPTAVGRFRCAQPG
jgi:pimeloyl-ACP methyl ester carboxylesterase